jgi:CubicO group peptidase (beta-lactamase class C family)
VRPKRKRRWPRRFAYGVVGVLVAALAVYGWAWLSVDRSTIARALIWGDSDIGDQFRFPTRLIPGPDTASPLPVGAEIDLLAPTAAVGGGAEFDDFLRTNATRAFLVVHNDQLVYERYFGGSDRQALETSFSTAKSFVSTLVGIAIDEGFIGSVEDPVTDYLPELAARDPRFQRITLRDLLTMSSGLRYWETDLPWPWADDTFTYYGADLREIALNRTEVERPPGEERLYNNYNPLLLGLVLERATGTSISEYMSTKLWQPLAAEHDATWNLDSESSGFEKMESGLNATAADYARFGLLFLHRGEWNGTRIVPEDWVHAATAEDTTTDPADFYQYFWWIDVERPGRFYALGNLGQYIYVAPDADAVIVRTGRFWGTENDAWLNLLREVADQLAHRP